MAQLCYKGMQIIDIKHRKSPNFGFTASSSLDPLPDSFFGGSLKAVSQPAIIQSEAVITWTVMTRALGSLSDDPSATMSLVITSIGNSLSLISSVDSAFGHSVQNSTTNEINALFSCTSKYYKI